MKGELNTQLPKLQAQRASFSMRVLTAALKGNQGKSNFEPILLVCRYAKGIRKLFSKSNKLGQGEEGNDGLIGIRMILVGNAAERAKSRGRFSGFGCEVINLLVTNKSGRLK